MRIKSLLIALLLATLPVVAPAQTKINMNQLAQPGTVTLQTSGFIPTATCASIANGVGLAAANNPEICANSTKVLDCVSTGCSVTGTATTTGNFGLNATITGSLFAGTSSLQIGPTSNIFDISGQTNIYQNAYLKSDGLNYAKAAGNASAIRLLANGIDFFVGTGSGANTLVNGSGAFTTAASISSAGVFSPTAGITLTSVVGTSYVEGSFTPVITFGGASTGITYTTQSGFYTRIGNSVLINAVMVLSSKGSASGTFIVTGLPFTVKNSTNNQYACSVWATTMAATATTALSAIAFTNTTTLGGYKFTAGSATGLSDTDFTNTTSYIVNCHYQI